MSLDHCRVLRGGDDRWFLVPMGTPIPAGTLAVRNETGGVELLKAGTLALWEIPEESAGLILEDRARRLGEKTGALLDGMLLALGVDPDQPEGFQGVMARSASPKAAEKTALKRRLDKARKETKNPELKRALTQLQARLLAD